MYIIEEMKTPSNQKGFAPILLLLGILIIGGSVVAGTLYLSKTHKNTSKTTIMPTDIPRSIPSQTKINTSPIIITPAQNPIAVDTYEEIDNQLKKYTNTEGKYSITLPKDWTISSHNDPQQPYEKIMVKGLTVFENKPFNNKLVKENPYYRDDSRVYGTIRIQTPDYIGGQKWKNISKEEFYNKQSAFWGVYAPITPDPTIICGPAYTTDGINEAMVGEFKAIFIVSHPLCTYEVSSGDDITYNYFIFLDPQRVLSITFSYVKKYPNINKEVEKFNTMLSTITLTD